MNTGANEHFLNLYGSCHEDLERFCRVLCRNSESTRELVQETLLRALQGYHRLKDETKFKSWLMGIALRTKRSQDRKLKNWVLMDILPEKAAQEQSDTEAALSMMRRLCRKLNEKEREAFLLFELSGLTLQSIAEIQETNENTVKTRLRRSREKLQKWLKKEYRTPEAGSEWSKLELSMEGKSNG